MNPRLRREVLRIVVPSAARTRQARRLARELARRLRAAAAQRGLDVTPTLVGSLAKDTHLADPLDVDVFVLFPRDTPRQVLEREGLALGHAVLPDGIERYAEHPYVHGRLDGTLVDIVPAYRLRSARGRLSAVDRTPFHTRYVKRHATARHREDTRLLKAFLRGVRCYGAETATGGLSGYLAELLVLRFGTFERVLQAVASWRPPVQVALEGPPRPLGGGPLVVIDPVDPDRNAAAAVTEPTLERFQRASRAFRARPSEAFFFPPVRRPMPPARLRARLRRAPIVGLRVAAARPGLDTLVPQGHRLLAKLGRAFAQNGFRVVRGDVFELAGGDLLLLAEHEPALLPAHHRHDGPADRNAEHRERFLQKWAHHADALSKPHLVRGRWVVDVRRRRRTAPEVFRDAVPALVQGFDLLARPPALLSDEALAAEDAHALPLTVFLERLEPWQGTSTRS